MLQVLGFLNCNSLSLWQEVESLNFFFPLKWTQEMGEKCLIKNNLYI